MNKKNTDETIVHTKPNLTPIMALLILNLLAVLLTIGILLVRTQSLTKSNSKALVVDRIGEIKLDKGNVIIDLMDLNGSNNKLEVTQSVTLRQEDFLKGFSSMEGFVKKLIEAGLVTANEPDPEEGQ